MHQEPLGGSHVCIGLSMIVLLGLGTCSEVLLMLLRDAWAMLAVTLDISRLICRPCMLLTGRIAHFC